MNIAVIAFSKCGAALAECIMALEGHETNGYIARRHAGGTGLEPFDSVYELTARLFHSVNALVYICACGIAVRAIAPLIQSKLTDPAVVVCDETGRFAVSLLSGHAGGANRLAEEIAACIGAAPVVTTASDSHAIAEGVEQPRNIILGIGCRRGLSAEIIERAATILLETLPANRICGIARNIGRDGQSLSHLTLGGLRSVQADMNETVFIGNSQTKSIGRRMVTLRGYRNE